jgi:hypothetical protein
LGYDFVDGVVFLGIEHQDGVFHNFVLEAIDLNDCELIVLFGRVLNTQGRIVDD